MKTEKMFAGLNKEEWGEALKDQRERSIFSVVIRGLISTLKEE